MSVLTVPLYPESTPTPCPPPPPRDGITLGSPHGRPDRQEVGSGQRRRLQKGEPTNLHRVCLHSSRIHQSSGGERPPRCIGPMHRASYTPIREQCGGLWGIPRPHQGPWNPASARLQSHQRSPTGRKQTDDATVFPFDWDFQHISLPNPPFPTSSHPVRLQHQAIRRTRDDGFECLIHDTFYHGHPDSASLGRQRTGGEGSCCSWHVHPAWHGILRCPWKPCRRCNLPTNGPNAVPSGEGRDRLALGSKTRPKASSCEPAQARGLPSRHPPHRLPGKIPIASFSVSSSVSDTEKQPRPGIPQFSSC